MNKRAELTSSQVATLILLIAGFLIALVFLLVFLDTKSMSEREVCHLSILSRATVYQAMQNLVPLKCKTEKICLSPNGKSDCTENQFLGVNKKEIIKKSVSSPRDLEKVVADSMLDCWAMTGEGKLDLFGGSENYILSLIGLEALGGKKTVCIICSRLAIDKVPQQILNEVDVTSFMENNLVPNSELTYLNLMTDRQVRSFPREFRQNLTEEREKDKGYTDEVAIIFMQINVPKNELDSAFGAAKNAGTIVFISNFGLGRFGPLDLGKSVLASVFVGTAVGTVAYFQTWANKDLAGARCGELTSMERKEARNGCSVVMPISYKDIQFINKHCSIIEGQP